MNIHNPSKQIYRILLVLFVGVAVFAALKNWFMPTADMPMVSYPVKSYNNFLIFKYSFKHIISESPLYLWNKEECYDLFKYTPTFALFFGLFSWGGDFVGLLLWSLINSLLPFYAILKLVGTIRQRIFGFSILLMGESLTSLLNSQSNGVILGLMILSLASFQKGRDYSAVSYILMCAFIKVFGILLFALYLFRREKLKQVVPFAFLLGLVFLLLPLVLVDFDYLKEQYYSWLNLLSRDSSRFVKYSVMGWIQNWFYFAPNKLILLSIGLILQFLFVFTSKNPSKTEIIQWGALWVVWSVIFNHMAESATFVIAIGGMMVYGLLQPQLSKVDYFIWLLVIFFTILGPTDIYPVNWRIWIVESAQLKVFPVMLFWIYATYTLNLTGIKKAA